MSERKPFVVTADTLEPEAASPTPFYSAPVVFEAPQRVEIEYGRWDHRISILDAGGREHVYIASADSFFTDGDGLWFGTEADHAARIKNQGF